MPCNCDGFETEEEFRAKRENKSYENLLYLMCQSCKYLTVDKILSIKGNEGGLSLKDWYLNHLLGDYRINNPKGFVQACKNEADIAQNEANRLGYVLSIDNGFGKYERITKGGSDGNV